MAKKKKLPTDRNYIKPLKRKTLDGVDVTAKSGKIKTASSLIGWDGFASNRVSAYRSSYMNSGQTMGAYGDVPIPFVMLNDNNGGIFYFPVSLKEKFNWYRFFYRTDPLVGAAIDMHIELPLSKLVLRMPEMEDKELSKKIKKKYEAMVSKIHLFDRLQDVLLDYFIIGNCFLWCEWDEVKKEWSKLNVLIPEEVDATTIPMSEYSLIRYKPEVLARAVHKLSVSVSEIESIEELKDTLDKDEFNMISNVPLEVLKGLANDGHILLDTNPFGGEKDEVGSFVHHFARRKQQYEDYGSSILERVLNPLILRELFKNTQVNLASRNMTPKNKITAPNITPAQLEELRQQVDLSYSNPEYAVVTNYDWQWEQIGADARLIDLAREYETIDTQIYAALGVTKELLTGEGMYSGSKISVEILNTRYLLLREMLQTFIEERLFLPVAEQNGFYKVDEDGNKTYFYPRVSFSRLTIRDNAEVFDSLFQLYQKGSIPVEILYDLFNLNSDEIIEKLKAGMFTAKDSQFNEVLRDIYSSVAQKIVDGTDISDQIIDSLNGPNGIKLKRVTPPSEQGLGGIGGLSNPFAPPPMAQPPAPSDSLGLKDLSTSAENSSGMSVSDFLNSSEPKEEAKNTSEIESKPPPMQIDDKKEKKLIDDGFLVSSPENLVDINQIVENENPIAKEGKKVLESARNLNVATNKNR